VPASDDFFLDWPSPRHVHDEGCDVAAQIEALVEFVGIGCEKYEALKLEIEALKSEVDGPGQDKTQKA
jgi:hypothetical protein